ncbi:MAG: S41 family peptidase [Bacteroidota bacterium]
MQRLLLVTVLFFSFFQANALVNTPTDSTKRSTEVNTIIKLANNYICNTMWLETPEWKTFVEKIQSEEAQRLSTQDFVSFFNTEVDALPFTHFYLRQIKKTKGSKKEKKAKKKMLPYFELKAIDDQTAHLVIREFASDGESMVKLVTEIKKKGYENLIIDLRSNTGGSLDAAVVLGRFLTQKPLDAGLYMTRKWFLDHSRYPTVEEIQTFPYLKDMTYEGFMKISQESAAFRMVLPPHNDPIFEGKTYLLTNSLTASACEPFVYFLKKEKIATVVGQTTAGAMLSGSWFPVSDNLRLFLPFADYMLPDGHRIDKVGVEPDVKKSHEGALSYVLGQLK